MTPGHQLYARISVTGAILNPPDPRTPSENAVRTRDHMMLTVTTVTRPLLDRYDGWLHSSTRYSGVWGKKYAKFRRNFDRKQTHFMRNHFSQPNPLGREICVKGKPQRVGKSSFRAFYCSKGDPKRPRGWRTASSDVSALHHPLCDSLPSYEG